jgi:hypothetical protein
MSPSIDPTTALRRSETMMATDLAPGEVLLMDVEQAKYFGLRGTAAAIWSRFEEPTTVDAVVASLLDEYDVDELRCRADTTACIEGMVARSLLSVVP